MEFTADYWKPVLKENSLDSFDAIWNLETEWFEEPNKRRGGWSGVAKLSLKTEKGDQFVFLKRQENHMTRSLLAPLGIPTFQKEFENIKKFNDASIPCLKTVYFGKKGKKAILITESLEGWTDLSDLITSELLTPNQLKEIIYSSAELLAKTHKAGLVHSCCYPKHIFANITIKDNQLILPEEIKTRFIDLERAQSIAFGKPGQQRDLDTLNRRSPWISNTNRLRFILRYNNKERLDNEAKTLVKAVLSKKRKK